MISNNIVKVIFTLSYLWTIAKSEFTQLIPGESLTKGTGFAAILAVDTAETDLMCNVALDTASINPPAYDDTTHLCGATAETACFAKAVGAHLMDCESGCVYRLVVKLPNGVEQSYTSTTIFVKIYDTMETAQLANRAAEMKDILFAIEIRGFMQICSEVCDVSLHADTSINGVYCLGFGSCGTTIVSGTATVAAASTGSDLSTCVQDATTWQITGVGCPAVATKYGGVALAVEWEAYEWCKKTIEISSAVTDSLPASTVCESNTAVDSGSVGESCGKEDSVGCLSLVANMKHQQCTECYNLTLAFPQCPEEECEVENLMKYGKIRPYDIDTVDTAIRPQIKVHENLLLSFVDEGFSLCAKDDTKVDELEETSVKPFYLIEGTTCAAGYKAVEKEEIISLLSGEISAWPYDSMMTSCSNGFWSYNLGIFQLILIFISLLWFLK